MNKNKIDKHSALHRVYLERKCPYCANRVKDFQMPRHITGYYKLADNTFDDIFSCHTCKKSWRINIDAVSSKEGKILLSCKEVNYKGK